MPPPASGHAGMASGAWKSLAKARFWRRKRERGRVASSTRAGFGGSDPGGYIGPHHPVLGGVPHLHLVAWPDLHPDPTWTAIAGRLRLAFLQVGIRDPWPHVMIANLIALPGLSGRGQRA
jgi:hypothetical protein